MEGLGRGRGGDGIMEGLGRGRGGDNGGVREMEGMG